MKTIPKTSITNLTPQCCEFLEVFFDEHKVKLFFSNSGSVNGIGEFSEDFTNEEDLDARNKMFEEVKMMLLTLRHI